MQQQPQQQQRQFPRTNRLANRLTNRQATRSIRQVSRQVSTLVSNPVRPQAERRSRKLEPVQTGNKSKVPVKLEFSKALSKGLTERPAKKAKKPIIILKQALPVPVKQKILPPIRKKHSESMYSDKLLKDLTRIVRAKEELVVRTQDLITELCTDLKKPWTTFNKGSNISPNQLAKLLKLYGLKSQGVWVRGVGSFKGYSRKNLIKAYKAHHKQKNVQTN